MAKCVKREVPNVDDEHQVYRVSDELAARAVASGLWHYTSKGAWKSDGRLTIANRLPGQEAWMRYEAE